MNMLAETTTTELSRPTGLGERRIVPGAGARWQETRGAPSGDTGRPAVTVLKNPALSSCGDG